MFSSISLLGSNCDNGKFLSVMGQIGFCFFLSGQRKPDEAGGESFLGGHECLVQICLGYSQQVQKQDWGQGPQDSSADALAGAHPLNCEDLMRERKAREVTEDTGA